jgi:hypothetical protein
MPDHFHGIVRIAPRRGRPGAGPSLGDVVGAFKSRVVHEYIAEVKAGRWPPFRGKVWHRNYYERILRQADEVARVQHYIRMNPWRNVVHFSNGMRGIGNPRLLDLSMVAMLCSRDCPEDVLATACQRASCAGPDACIISGFHSPPEKAILHALLQGRAKLICCPAWGIDDMKLPAEWLPALEQNRMLILDMRNGDGNLAAAEERNAFVLQAAHRRWIPHCTPGGMIARVRVRAGRGRNG